MWYKNFLCSIFDHQWYYFGEGNIGLSDNNKRVCARCKKIEYYRGKRSFYHDKESIEWMTNQAYRTYLDKLEELKKY